MAMRRRTSEGGSSVIDFLMTFIEILSGLMAILVLTGLLVGGGALILSMSSNPLWIMVYILVLFAAIFAAAETWG